MKKALLLITAALLVGTTATKATHIVGGEFSVKWVSGNTFHVTLHFYRDCANGTADFDNPANFGIYDKVTNASQPCLSVPLGSRTTLTLGDSCYTPDLCVELGTYDVDVVIPNNPNGYYISYDRCCRNGAVIINIQNPGLTGEAWYAEIPDPALHNSTPVFGPYPRGYLCVNNLNVQDFSCTDVDNDSLVYSLITPLAGNSSNNNTGNTCPDPGPYPSVVFQAPYSATNMIGGVPAMSINPQTGILTANPPNQGGFVFCVRVEEFRRSDKLKLGEVRRDIEYLVLPCSVAAAYPDTTVCSGSPVTLHATGGTAYKWAPTTGLSNPNIANPVATVSSNTTYTVSVTNGNCVSTATVTVNVNNGIKVSITPNGPTTFCQGGSVLLTASGANNYSWNTGATTVAINVNSSGTYSVTGTLNGCVGASSTLVTVNPNPVVTIAASGPTTFCQGGTVTLTAGGGTTYLWNTGATASAITVNSSATYSVTGTTKSCSGASATAVNVNPTPKVAITAGGPVTFCQGDSVALTASGGLTYIWNTGSTHVSIEVSINQTYSAVGIDGNGCTANSNSITVTVNRPPIVSVKANGPTSFCVGGSVQVCASGGVDYVWSPGGSTSNCININTQGHNSVAVTGTNGCKGSSGIDITVLPVPVVTISPSGPTSFCAGGAVSILASGADTYLWSPTSETTTAITVKNSGAYHVVGTNKGGCSDTSNVINVNVNPLPIVTATPNGPTTFCIGGSVMLTGSGASSYVWNPTSENTTAITVSTIGSFYTVGTDANRCTDTSNTVSVIVNPNPTVSIIPQGKTAICEGQNVGLCASNGTTFSWNLNGGTAKCIAAFDPGSYVVTITDDNGCVGVSDPLSVTVDPPPTMIVSADGPTNFCVGGNVTLTATTADNYLWNTGDTTASIVVSGNGSFFATGTNNDGCSATSNTVDVNVNPLPTVVAVPNGPTNFCIGGSVTITGSGAVTYLWNPTDDQTTSITVSAAGSYFAVGTDVNGCKNTSNSIPITVNPNPTVSVVPQGPTSICEGGSVQLCASNGITFSWNLNGGTSQCFTAMNPGNYIVSITDANGCAGVSQPLTVTVGAPPSISANVSGPITCSTNSVTLLANNCIVTNGITYNWNGPASFSSIEQCPAATVAGTYTVTASNGCPNTAITTVETNMTTPDVTATSGELTCLHPSIQLSGSSTTTGVSYNWTGPNGFTSNQQNPTVSDSGIYIVTVTASINGCTNFATVYVSKLPSQIEGVCGDQGSVGSGVYFELNGNPNSTQPNPPDNWDLVYKGTSLADYTSGIITDAPSNADDYFYQGSKDIQDIPQWNTAIHSVPDKDDLLHAGVAIYGHLLYFFTDRFAVNGNSQMGFWLLKDNVQPANGGTFSGKHEVGDLLILSDFETGGGNPVLFAYEWVGSGGSDGTLNKLTLDEAYSYAIVNSVPVSSPWPYTPKSGTPGILPAGAFFEGGIDLACVQGKSIEGCFPSFLIESRASQSVTAELKDYVFGNLFPNPNVVHRIAQPEEKATPMLLAYPNPFGKDINIEFFAPLAEEASVMVMDVTGRLIESFRQPSGIINTGSNLSPGVYFVTLSQGDYFKTIKIVKTR